MACLIITLLFCTSFAQAAQIPVDEGLIRTTVDSLIAIVNREYIDPDVAKQVASVLQNSLAAGKYSGAKSAEDLSLLLTRDMYSVTQDKHLSVAVVRDVPKADPFPLIDPDEARALDVRRSNAGVRRVEILPGNVGYLDLSFFYRPEEARDALASAMHLLRNADALIIDMRRNGGGSPDTIALLMSYFFDEPALPVFDIIHRSPEPAAHYSTEVPAVADHNGQRPIFVLTAKETFSGGEGLAFLLQERHRAEVIGETTAGAANPGRPYPVNERFSVTVPNGRIKSAVRGGNWEGAGVTPDVKTSAEKTLGVAYTHALRVLIEKEPSGLWRNQLLQILSKVEVNPGQ